MTLEGWVPEIGEYLTIAEVIEFAFDYRGNTTIVTAEATRIRAFVDEHGTGVAKPIDGYAGRGALRLQADDPNVGSIVEVMTARGAQPIVARWIL